MLRIIINNSGHHINKQWCTTTSCLVSNKTRDNYNSYLKEFEYWNTKIADIMKIGFVTKMAVKPPNNSVATQIKIMLNVLHQNYKREYKSSTIHQIPNRMTAQTFVTGDWREGARRKLLKPS